MSKTDALPGVTKGNQLTLEILPADDDEDEDSLDDLGPLYMLSDLSRKPSHLEAELSSAPRFGECSRRDPHGWMDGSMQRRVRIWPLSQRGNTPRRPSDSNNPTQTTVPDSATADADTLPATAIERVQAVHEP
mmetsp:Transcript_5117/g.12034  ORF Transcript_5117/g.12034 Transcript_5117/m.12034 type:complete len:133 (-) Transcript_5117:137-535(-)